MKSCSVNLDSGSRLISLIGGKRKVFEMSRVNIDMLEAGLCRSAAVEEDAASEIAFTEKKVAYNVTSLHRLAKILSVDPDLWVCQQFDRLNLFYIVYLQQHLLDLERRLDQAVPDNVEDFDKAAFEGLMPDLESSLKKYGTLPPRLDVLVNEKTHCGGFPIF